MAYEIGNVTEEYDYAAFGESLLIRDPFPGEFSDPVSLHRYLYANANPITFADPGGISVSADIVAFVAVIAGSDDVATTATYTSLASSLSSVGGMFKSTAGGVVKSKVKQKAVEVAAKQTQKKALQDGTANAAIDVLEHKAKRIAAKNLVSESVEAVMKLHLDDIIRSASPENFLPSSLQVQKAATQYVRTVLALRSGAKQLNVLITGFKAATGTLRLQGLELAAPNAVVRELTRIRSYAKRGIHPY